MLGFGLLIGLAFPFVVVLLRLPRDKAETAERARRAVAEAEITEAGQRIPITVSIGGSGLPDKNATNPQELIGAADVVMYTAKESGRDRCVIA
jgi:diguanylate cyclase (GGDEF)-like protein